MIQTRRNAIEFGAVILAELFSSRPAITQDSVKVLMRGNPDGSRVWFDPIGLLIAPGQTITWVNQDIGNSHSTTAYHPTNFGHPLRIPKGAEPWNSDYLLPEESFSVRLTTPGIYDYYCIPHEHAGMVGRIIVGTPGDVTTIPETMSQIADLPFPPVEKIMQERVVSYVPP